MSLDPGGRMTAAVATSVQPPVEVEAEADSSLRSRMRRLQKALRPIALPRQADCCTRVAGAGRSSFVQVHLTETCDGKPRAYYQGLQRCGSPWSCPTCRQRTMIVRSGDVELAIQANGVRRCLLVTGTIRHGRRDDLAFCQQLIKRALSKFQQGEPWRRGKAKLGWSHHVVTWEHTWSEVNGWHSHFHGIVFCDDEGVPELDRPDASVYGFVSFDDSRREHDADYYGLGSAKARAIALAWDANDPVVGPSGLAPVRDWARPATWEDWAKDRWKQSVLRVLKSISAEQPADRREGWLEDAKARFVPTSTRGLDFERCESGGIDKYLAKLGLEQKDFEGAESRFKNGAARRLGLEVAELGGKQPRVDGMTPLQIAQRFVECDQLRDRLSKHGVPHDDPRFVEVVSARSLYKGLWREYAKVMADIRHMTWSRGARAALGLVKAGDSAESLEHGVDDADIAASEDAQLEEDREQKLPVALIPGGVYYDLVRSGADDFVLTAAQKGVRGDELVEFARSLMYGDKPRCPVPDELAHGPVQIRGWRQGHQPRLVGVGR